MTVKDLKTEIYKLIDDIDDKNILALLKEEIITYTTTPQTDILEGLNDEQMRQLTDSVTQGKKKEESNLKGYKKLIARWLIK